MRLSFRNNQNGILRKKKMVRRTTERKERGTARLCMSHMCGGGKGWGGNTLSMSLEMLNTAFAGYATFGQNTSILSINLKRYSFCSYSRFRYNQCSHLLNACMISHRAGFIMGGKSVSWVLAPKKIALKIFLNIVWCWNGGFECENYIKTGYQSPSRVC